MSNIFTKWKHLIPVEKSATGHQQLFEGGREWEDTYRDRWSFDKCVHSTHGVNCTGSCCWNIYVKNGLVAWENQEHNYPETSPDMPDFEPRGCPRGATFSWYLYAIRTASSIRICAASSLRSGARRARSTRRLLKPGEHRQ